MDLIPATVLTGFLGAGKTTMLKRILTEDHGRRIAVIENEFAEENIDGELIASAGDERIVQLSNGCLCCTIRDDLRITLRDLADRRSRGEIAFDQVIIETTGLADPGPIAQTFFLDDAVTRDYRPDAILTLVDSKFGLDQLEHRAEARRQIGFADRIFISKTDLVDQANLDCLLREIAAINARTRPRTASFGAVDLADVFDVGGFNLTDDPELAFEPPAQACADGHSADDHAHHHHDSPGRIASFVFRADRPLHPTRFGQFLSAVAKSNGDRLLRYKGVLAFAGADRKVIVQGVHQLTSSDWGAPWAAGEARCSRLVFIGEALPENLFRDSLTRCLV